MFEKNKFSEKIKPALSAMYPDADAAEKQQLAQMKNAKS